MKKLKIAVLCPAEIAFRRFMPALSKCEHFEYIGVAVASSKEWFGENENVSEAMYQQTAASEYQKAHAFQQAYRGAVFTSYEELLASDADAVYIPLPPALHFHWAKQALLRGKHVFLEKPFTIRKADTAELIALAAEKQLALHENYMFPYHSQMEYIQNKIEDGAIGNVRLYRIAFGFPFRGAKDFRYHKSMGGGALFDCGGYTIKLASILLGETAKITASQQGLDSRPDVDVDIYGSCTMVNSKSVAAQLSFGMDNSYKCELEVWGSEGSLYAGRILTAPADFRPQVEITTASRKTIETLPADDSFQKSIAYFAACIENDCERTKNYESIRRQSEFMEQAANPANQTETELSI